MSLESFGMITKAKKNIWKTRALSCIFLLRLGIRKDNIRKLLLKILSEMQFSKLRNVINTYMWNWYGMEYKYVPIFVLH